MRFATALLIAALGIVACGDNHEATPDGGPTGPACSDGVDNDGDGDFDFPDDLGCDSTADDSEDSPAKPACSDGRDNDGDGKKDFPNDPGCALPQLDDEQDKCPDDPSCPQCANKRDDDQNGQTDYPNDTGCESAADTSEFFSNSTACGAGLQIKPLPVTGMVTETLDAVVSRSQIPTTCGGGGGAPGFAYVLILNEPKIIVASTDHPGTSADTVIDIRSQMCADPGAEIVCHDDVDLPDNPRSALTVSLQPGIYYIIVQGHDTAVTGAFELTVEQFNGEGVMCVMDSDCGPGLVCRVPVGQTQMVCTDPVCSDGLDDDGDGKIDYPLDPGCVGPADSTEDDDCPSGPTCPACADGDDNDGDGNTDYPMDTSCAAASSVSEACSGEDDPITSVTSSPITGTMVGASDDHNPSCGGDGGPDKLFTLVVPAMQQLTINTDGTSFDTLLSLLPATCAEPSIECDDDDGAGAASLIERTNLPGGLYHVAVDAYSGTTTLGAFTLNVSGIIAPGAPCEGELATAGVIACGPGLMCLGAVGSKICSNECTDGADNNGDGKIDYPEDPGCASPNDDDENTVCPGPTCPECSDGTDNDGDGDTDYPDDASCLAASAGSEACPGEVDPVGVLAAPLTTGTLVGASDDHNPSCGGDGGADRQYAIQVPELSLLTIDTDGSDFDTLLSLLPASCSEPSIECDDDDGDGNASLIQRTNVAAGAYYVAVDAYSGATTPGAYNINISGTIAPFGSCELPLVASGALTCGPGYTCMGAPGSRICSNECVDGVDNNGDGAIDFPDDPGCTSTSDATEDTVCPGPACPQCADGVDNDTDASTDYPLDTSCASASSHSEYCQESEPVALVTAQLTTGTTLGATDDIDVSCADPSGSGRDVTLRLDVPAMSSLALNLSVNFNSAHALFGSTCGGTALACQDPTTMSLSNIAAGTYYLVVDGRSVTDQGDFTLDTTGVVATGGSCEGALFQSGAFTCAAGFACLGPAGMRTCEIAGCNDGMDNNGDGNIDFPADPGCTSPNDGVEDTLCPGPSCPACSNALDDDGDTTMDWPGDVGCIAASDTDEAFCPIELEYAGAIAMPVTTGTLAAPATDSYEQTCQVNTGNDVAYSLQAPVAATWLITTEGSAIGDSVVAVRDGNCGATLGCDDDSGTDNLSRLQVTLPAGNYAILVDSFQQIGNNGAFTLNVTGVAAAGAACTSPLFAAGVLACPMGQTCTAGTCQ